MYECPNCGGNLKFDIASQQLACAYCNAQYDPYSISKERDAEEDNSYDVTIFICPQCAGEIYSTDNTAAGFCSFCGASTILDSRLQRERRPGYIIPFKKTKEDCKKAYSKQLRFAIFAPKALKNAKHIDSFRGIYMPYWVYYIKQKGNISLHGTTEKRKGDYIITSHYNLHAYLEAHYKGMPYDASSSFADNISEKIAPFDVKNMKNFAPAFLSGFYADASDVESTVYEESAKDVATSRTAQFVRKHPDMKRYHIEDKEETLKSKFNTVTENVDTAMFPVWFLSYRNKDRVAYATVNGQTGKVVADLPVDIKKYLFGSLLLALPLFCLLNLLFTVTPSILLTMVSLIAMLSVILHAVEMKQIVVREGYEDDKGVLAALAMKRKRKQEEKAHMKAEAAASLEELDKEPFVVAQEKVETTRKKEKQKKNKTSGTKEMGLVKRILGLVKGIFYTILIVFLFQLLFFGGSKIVTIAVLVIAAIFCKDSFSSVKQIETKRGLPGSLWSLLATILGTVIVWCNPVSDIFYYAGAIVSLLAVFFTLLDLIQSYNILATRRLPQFDYQGGDDRA